MSSSTMITTELVYRTRSGNVTNHINKTSSSGIERPRTLYVGKDQYLVSLFRLAQVSDVAWKKKAVFYLLTSTVNSLLGYHKVYDFITLVGGEVPMDRYSTLQNS